jgi:hypothetical protein
VFGDNAVTADNALGSESQGIASSAPAAGRIT